MTTSCEWVRIWKEAVSVYLNVLTRISAEETEENHKNIRTANNPTKNRAG
jgi:hypothetical protein